MRLLLLIQSFGDDMVPQQTRKEADLQSEPVFGLAYVEAVATVGCTGYETSTTARQIQE